MINNLRFVLTVVAALGCGLIAGVFFAFSTFVMGALAGLPPAQGVAAMQSINVVVLNRWFLTAFLGTAATCVLLAVLSVATWHEPGAAYRLVGSVLYLAGTVVVTRVFNVPLNDALAAAAPTSASAAILWASYLADWTSWNHVRTAASFAAVAGDPVIGGLHGEQARHHHCDWCKSWVFTRIVPEQGFINVRAGALDDPSWFAPFVETYTSEGLPWAKTGARHSYPQFPAMEQYGPLVAEFAAAYPSD